MKKYFEVPTQVAFWNGDSYSTGIAYRDEIICACCGGIFELNEVIEEAAEDKVVALCPLSWEDFTSEIRDANIETVMELANRNGVGLEDLQLHIGLGEEI